MNHLLVTGLFLLSTLHIGRSLEITYDNQVIPGHKISRNKISRNIKDVLKLDAVIKNNEDIKTYCNDLETLALKTRKNWQSIHPHWGIGGDSLNHDNPRSDSSLIFKGLTFDNDSGNFYSLLNPSRLSLLLTTHAIYNENNTILNNAHAELEDCKEVLSIANLNDLKNPDNKLYLSYKNTNQSKIFIPSVEINQNSLEEPSFLLKIKTDFPLQLKLEPEDTNYPCFLITPTNEVKFVGFYYFQDQEHANVYPVAYPPVKSKIDSTILQTALEGTGKPDIIKSLVEKVDELKLASFETNDEEGSKIMCYGTPASPHSYLFRNAPAFETLTHIFIEGVSIPIQKKEYIKPFWVIHIKPQNGRLVIIKPDGEKTLNAYVDNDKKAIQAEYDFPYKGTPVFQGDFIFTKDLYCVGLGSQELCYFNKERVAGIHYSILNQAIELK